MTDLPPEGYEPPPPEEGPASVRHRAAASRSRLRHDNSMILSRSKDAVYTTTTGAEMLWLLDLVTACARALEGMRATALAAGGLDAPARRLLTELHDSGPRPVPRLAEALGMTRQAVQPTVDARIAAGHVELLPNWTKRRSPLVRLTEAGFWAVVEVHAHDLDAAARLGERFLASHVSVTRQTLANLIYATTGARAFDLPMLRGNRGLAVYPVPGMPSPDAALLRHPLAAAGLNV